MTNLQRRNLQLLGIFFIGLLPTSITNATPAPLQLAQLPNPIPPNDPSFPAPKPPPPASPSLEYPTPAPQIEPQLPVVGSIKIERFEFEGNTVFSDEELAAVTEKFTKRSIEFNELLQVEAALTQKYVNAGYINSGAVIPANQILQKDGAVVQVKIVEGELEEIEIAGLNRLNPNYIKSRLELAGAAPLNRSQLLEGLQLLQLNPLIKNISAELQPGIRPEKSRLQVEVLEANSFKFELFADNNRSPSVGSFRRGLRLEEGNLLGLGDRAQLSYANTDGSHEIDGSYTLPVNAQNGTLKLALGAGKTRVIEPPFDTLNIQGTSQTYELTYQQPVIFKPAQELSLGLTFSHQKTQTTLDGEGFPLSAGANNNGETKTSVIRFFQEYVHRDIQQVFAARSQFSLGTGLLGATINSDAPDSRFFSWRGQAQYLRLLAPETLLIVRSDLQLATDSLLSLEQIGLGGGANVRGYRQDLLLTDNGFFTSVEARIPILRIPEAKSLLQIAPFIDFGIGWNHQQQKNNQQLLGAGVGLIWQIEEHLNARLDWAIPLIKNDSSNRTWQEQGIYFNVNYFPF